MLTLQNNILEFPEERVCVINAYPIVEKSIQETFFSLKKLGLSTVLWKYIEKDVRTYFYFYCVQNLYEVYNNHNTKYRKVFVFCTTNKNTVTDRFIKNNLTAMLKVCTFPWCTVTSLASPELCSLAAKACENQHIKVTKLTNFLEKNNLHRLTKRIKKNIFRQKNTVDFSLPTE
jgi:hypothetical protein